MGSFRFRGAANTLLMEDVSRRLTCYLVCHKVLHLKVQQRDVTIREDPASWWEASLSQSKACDRTKRLLLFGPSLL